MRLFTRQCGTCKKISIRRDGDNEWQQGNNLDYLKEKHEVVSHEDILCTECQRSIVEAAGSVH